MSSPVAAISGQADDLSLSSYEFELPVAAIAQRPASRRDASRLMVVDPRGGTPKHALFSEVSRFLQHGDLLVLNDSRVIPARLLGRRPSGAPIEVLLVERQAPGRWTALARPARKVRAGTTIEFPGGLRGQCVEQGPDGRTVLHFSAPDDVEAAVTAAGQVPLPPYIRRPLGPDRHDAERYQTVYARHPGSIAAPTAGLHFTQELLDDLTRQGVELACVTLHVGPGTFQPVRSEDVTRHRLDGEHYHIPAATARAVAEARAAGRRVIAVGTTATRALEAAATADGDVRAGGGVAETVIRPGYEFRVVQGLLTNFHLPRSSLLLLVSAFVGREALLRCYHEALARQYRFYSYGDAMLIADQAGQAL